MTIFRFVACMLAAMGFLAVSSAAAGEQAAREAVSQAADAAVEADATPWFSLMGWWGPPPNDTNLGVYRRALLNRVPIALQAATPAALDRALAHELTVMLELHGVGPFDLETIPAAIREHPAIAACLVYEGVTADTAAEAVRRAGVLRAFAPDWTPIATVRPNLDAPAWETAAASLAAAGVPVLPLVLPFADDDTTDEAALYAVLRGAAAAAREGGAPLWGLVQVNRYGDRRHASESDMRLQAYANLAYGARGLVYFSYWRPRNDRAGLDAPAESFSHTMADPRRGTPEYGHQMARIINAEIILMARHLEALEPLRVYFAGDIPEGGEALPRDAGPITRLDSARAMVGFFRGADGDEWALVVNRQHGARRSAQTQGRTIGIGYDDGITAITAIERQTGLEIPVPVDSGYFTVTMPGGTGTLLRFERGYALNAE